MPGNRQVLGPPTTCAHMERFLETCLLFLVDEDSAHGYGLMDRLGEFGFPADSFNVGTLYRTLRRLEEEELVSSYWEEGGQGPRRRVYTITPKGREDLAVWIEVIRRNKQRIERLLSRYAALHDDRREDCP